MEMALYVMEFASSAHSSALVAKRGPQCPSDMMCRLQPSNVGLFYNLFNDAEWSKALCLGAVFRENRNGDNVTQYERYEPVQHMLIQAAA